MSHLRIGSKKDLANPPITGAFTKASGITMLPESLVLTIPHLPITLNRWTRMHWTKRAQHARMWRQILDAHAPRKPRPYFARPVIVTLVFSSKRCRDGDGMAKFILDGCCGVLFPDDSPKWIKELRVRSNTGPPKTTICVEVTTSLP